MLCLLCTTQSLYQHILSTTDVLLSSSWTGPYSYCQSTHSSFRNWRFSGQVILPGYRGECTLSLLCYLQLLSPFSCCKADLMFIRERTDQYHMGPWLFALWEKSGSGGRYVPSLLAHYRLIKRILSSVACMWHHAHAFQWTDPSEELHQTQWRPP
jgi:hypothetical protein